METIKVPDGYQQVMPYLILKDAEQFQSFTRSVFQSKEKQVIRRDDKTIMHGELTIGNTVFMFAQSSDEYEATPGAFFIYVNNADETFAKALAAGATNILDLEDKEYGRSGGVKDQNGNTWWITSVK